MEQDGYLDLIRQEILNVASQNPDLDSGMLKNQFKGAGLADALAGLSEPSLYKLWRFASADASPEDARAGWRHLAELFERRRLAGEIDAARADLGRNMTEDTWARFDRLHRQMRQSGDMELDADDPIGPAEWSPPGSTPAR